MHKRSPCANVFRRACKSKARACVTYIITTPHPMRKRMCLSTQQAWNCIDGSTRFVCKLSYKRCRSSPRGERTQRVEAAQQFSVCLASRGRHTARLNVRRPPINSLYVSPR